MTNSQSDKLGEWLRENAPDCGDNSCLFGGRGKGGMRTNGGCRCYKDVRPDMRRIYIERMQAALSALPPSGRNFPICKDHKSAGWNQPQLEDDDCILCHLFYLEAQESLLEEWQQRAKRAEDALAETKRPLDEQMARLNETVTRLNGELAARSASAAPIPETVVAGRPTTLMVFYEDCYINGQFAAKGMYYEMSADGQ